MNLNGILIGSDNAPRLAHYYTKLLGTPSWDDGGYVGWLVAQAAKRAGENGRKTVRAHDFIIM